MNIGTKRLSFQNKEVREVWFEEASAVLFQASQDKAFERHLVQGVSVKRDCTSLRLSVVLRSRDRGRDCILLSSGPGSYLLFLPQMTKAW